MRKYYNKSKTPPSPNALLDPKNSPADEVIRLSPDVPSSEPNDLTKSDKLEASSFSHNKQDKGSTSGKQPAVLFESNVLVDKLEHDNDGKLGKGFRSKDLDISDLEAGGGVGKVLNLEEQWNQEGDVSHLSWVTKLIIVSFILILGIGVWAFSSLKLKEEKGKPDNNLTLLNEQDQEKKAELELVKMTTAVTSFLEATTVQDRVKWCRQPDETLKKMNLHFSREHDFETFKFIEIKETLGIKLSGLDATIATVKVFNEELAKTNQEELTYVVLLRKEDGTYMVDWPAFAIYQPSDMKSFTQTMSTEPHTFRLEVGSRVNVGPYLFSFSDDSQYQAYRVNIRGDNENYLYAYAKTGSEVDEKLKSLFPQIGGRAKLNRKIVLSLAYPKNSDTQQCVEIIDVVSEHWLLP